MSAGLTTTLRCSEYARPNREPEAGPRAMRGRLMSSLALLASVREGVRYPGASSRRMTLEADTVRVYLPSTACQNAGGSRVVEERASPAAQWVTYRCSSRTDRRVSTR